MKFSLPRGKSYVLAISGGVDSMVLCDLVARSHPTDELCLAHFNHKTRKASDADEAFVACEAQRRGIRFFSKAREGDGVSEASLRDERRAFLESIRVSTKSDFIVTAHHSEDQLETFLMRLMRGTGLDGLSSISRRSGRWLRPLLKISKEELKAYAEDHEISFREDSTNGESRYFRNRVRHELSPKLFELAPGGKSAFLDKFSSLINELQLAKRGRKRATEKWYSSHVVETRYWSRVSRNAFLRLPREKRKRAFRTIVDKLGVKALSREQVKAALLCVNEGKGATAGNGISIHPSCDQLFFSTTAQRKMLGRATLASLVDVTSEGKDTELRFFSPGDVFRGKKLKRLLLERRIPGPERLLVPVLAKKKSREVLWVFPDAFPGIQVNYVHFPFTFLP